MRFAASAIVYLSGAVGFESLSGAHREAVGASNDLLYSLLTTAEESLEMAGLILFCGTLMTLLSDGAPLTLRLGAPGAAGAVIADAPVVTLHGQDATAETAALGERNVSLAHTKRSRACGAPRPRRPPPACEVRLGFPPTLLTPLNYFNYLRAGFRHVARNPFFLS